MSIVIGLVAALGMALIVSADEIRQQQQPMFRRDHLQRAVVAILSAVALQFIVQIVTLSCLAMVMVFWVSARRDRDRAQRQALLQAEAWPDLLESLVASLRSGMSLPSALNAWGQNTPDPLRARLAPLFDALREGLPLQSALSKWRDEARDAVVDRVCLALSIASAVGGRALHAVLINLAAFLRAEVRTRGELFARQSWTVNAARLAVAAPWLMVLILGSRAREAYQAPMGSLILLAGAVATWLGYEWMAGLSKLPTPRRIFA